MASILKVNELKDAGGNAIITSNGSGAVTYSGVDLNGTELVLDADADTSITADTDDQIDIKIAGTDRVHINSLGNVGIGTSSIDVSTQAGGSGFQVLQIENDEGGQINLDHNDAGTGSTLGQINFMRAGEVVAEIEGVTDGATDNGKINFRTQPDGGALTTRWTIDHNGIIYPGATTQGIALGVTAATSTNILDDYEEGTYAYTIVGSNSGNLVLRSGYARGSYVKIGNWVHVDLRFETSSDNSIDGNLRWSLPFTMATPNGSDVDACTAPGYIRDNSMGTDARTGVYLLSQGDAYVQYLFSREGAANSTVEVADHNDTDGVLEGNISISYRTT